MKFRHRFPFYVLPLWKLWRRLKKMWRGKPRIYLAHSWYMKRAAREIQKKLTCMTYEVYNPFDKEQEDVTWVGETTKELALWIIDVDYDEIRNSDILVCIFPFEKKPTIGTPCEMTYAHFLDIPIYCYVGRWMRGHPWPLGMAERVFTNRGKLLKFMRELRMK